MHLHLARYGAVSGDGRGYRWIWQASVLSETLLNRCYLRLDCGRFADSHQMRLLQAHAIEGGLLTLDGDWCATYRFLHGGRDGSREKFFLVVAFFPRTALSRLDLSALFRHPSFTTAQETSPPETTLELPDSSFPTGSLNPTPMTMSEASISGPDSLSRAVAICAAVPANRGFHVRFSGDLRTPTARLERDSASDPADHPASPLEVPPRSVTVSPFARSPIPVSPPAAKRSVPFALGLCAGLIVGVVIGWILGNRTTEQKHRIRVKAAVLPRIQTNVVTTHESDRIAISPSLNEVKAKPSSPSSNQVSIPTAQGLTNPNPTSIPVKKTSE